jgi:glycosyltransferase involved in cell wall biosynthesis
MMGFTRGDPIVSTVKPLVSVVCPAFHEEAVLPHFHDRLAQVLDGLDASYRFEVVYIDDGSTDGTLERMRQLAQADPRVRYLSLSRNFGKEAALAAGLAHSCGEAVITLDTDLQHPPDLIPELLARWRDGHDVVRTERLNMHQDSFSRRLTARLFHRLMRWLNGNREPATSDYQLLSRRVVDVLCRMPEAHRYVRGLVTWMGFPACVLPFQVASRAGGTSKFTTGRLLSLAGDGVLSFSRLPLRLSLVAGLALFLLGLLDATGATLWLIFSGPLFPWQLHVLVATELVLAGMVLSGLGIVGEYVGRIYEQVKQRPMYLLKERSPVKAALPRSSEMEGESAGPWSSSAA